MQALSGGNQQKVVIAKWLATKPRVLILDEPTRGVDIGAKVEVHRIVSELAASGLAIVLISSDLPEVLGDERPDRRPPRGSGRTAEIARAEATEERVMFAATGQRRRGRLARRGRSRAAPTRPRAGDARGRCTLRDAPLRAGRRMRAVSPSGGRGS